MVLLQFERFHSLFVVEQLATVDHALTGHVDRFQLGYLLFDRLDGLVAVDLELDIFAGVRQPELDLNGLDMLGLVVLVVGFWRRLRGAGLLGLRFFVLMWFQVGRVRENVVGYLIAVALGTQQG